MASDRVALIDATDLFPQDQRDFLVQAAYDGLFRMVWSDTILQETACAVHRRLRERDGVSRRPATERMLQQLTTALTNIGAGQALDEQQIRDQIEAMGDDPAAWGTTDRDDRHIIAAAIVGGVDVVVTTDGSFDAEFCQREFGIKVQKADEYLIDVFGDATDEHIRVPFDALASRWKKPAPFNRAQVLGRLREPLPDAMEFLINQRGFDVADPPADDG